MPGRTRGGALPSFSKPVMRAVKSGVGDGGADSGGSEGDSPVPEDDRGGVKKSQPVGSGGAQGRSSKSSPPSSPVGRNGGGEKKSEKQSVGIEKVPSGTTKGGQGGPRSEKPPPQSEDGKNRPSPVPSESKPGDGSQQQAKVELGGRQGGGRMPAKKGPTEPSADKNLKKGPSDGPEVKKGESKQTGGARERFRIRPRTSAPKDGGQS